MRANGTRTSFTYDNADQVTQIEHRLANGNMLSNFTYTYDAAGNRTGESGARSRSYDAVNQLTVENRLGTLTTYLYDSVGNRTLYLLEGQETATST